jgi:thioesterase domain-containing protein
MHSGQVADGTPLFMVAGMFGNVLNLSHMAHLLGEDRPFYALQARGLYGDAEPHESFEAMAEDYLREVRQVQPEGPYLLGGFSGGGIVAYEMARQLLDAGETVLQVILLDTPITEPSPLSFADRVEMTLHGLRAGGMSYLRRKLADRVEWEKQRREQVGTMGSDPQADTGTFQSARIGEAFVRAVDRYRMPRVPVDVALFRPRLDVQFTFRDGRRINADRRYIAEDNLWTPYVSRLEVAEVPGNHDNMVLEPNVRVLAAAIRKSITKAEAGESVSPAE